MLMTLGQIAALFTAPALAAAGAAAVSIPIAIHLLSRLRRQRVVWAAMRFLEEAWKRQRRRMQLEQWLLLLVRCLLMAVLGLALAGPQSALLGALGLSQSSRLICVVLDDSLATRAADANGQARFETLKAQAISIIDAAQPGDRLAVWTTSSPVKNIITAGPVDREAARGVIEALTPTYAKADLASAMTAVGEVMLETDLPRDRLVLAVVSDFSLGTLNPSQAPPAVMVQVAERASVWLRRPNLALSNVQITSMTSTRGMLLASPFSPLSVPLTLGLSRFGSDKADQLSVVHVTLQSAHGMRQESIPQKTLQRELRWAAGQSQAVMNIEVPAADMLPAGGVMVIAARVESVTQSDALPADDQRWMTLNVKQQLRVGLVALPAQFSADQQTLTQSKWLELALAPASGQAMELVTLDPAKLDEATLAKHDALLVARPDLVSQAGWQSLAQAASAGKLVWVFTPSGTQTGGSASWPGAMRSAFDLPWSMGMDAMDFDEPLALASDTRVPEALAMLGPDWQDMQRTVRVMKLLNLNLQTAPASDAWLTTTDGKVVMASRPMGQILNGVETANASTNAANPSANTTTNSPTNTQASPSGQGQIIVLAMSIDPAWTDLMVKPLYVPLVHETLRGVLGQIAARQQNNQTLPGQKLTLPARWADASSLKFIMGVTDSTAKPNDQPNSENDSSQTLLNIVTNRPPGAASNSAASVRMTQQPVTLPGIYEAVSTAGMTGTTANVAVTSVNEKLLAVNLDAQAGDTRAGAGASLVAWFGLDQPEPWINQTDPGSMLTRVVTQADLGLPLLWLVLLLLLFETILARRFSHSQTTNTQPSWISRWWQRMVS